MVYHGQNVVMGLPRYVFVKAFKPINITSHFFDISDIFLF